MPHPSTYYFHYRLRSPPGETHDAQGIPHRNISLDENMESHQCRYTKQNGERCRRRSVIGFEYCFTHKEKALKVKAQDSQLHGKGLFASNGIRGNQPHDVVFRRNQRITRYHGIHRTRAQVDHMYGESDNGTAPYVLSTDHGFIDGATKRGTAGLINHTQHNPNVRFEADGDVVAKRNIKDGTELLVNYGDEYQLNNPNERHSTNKRKRDRAIDFH